jgi:enoyl-CoA hydratase/carnithine racemase
MKAGGVMTAVLSRAPGNALNLALLADLQACVNAVSTDSSVRVLVLESSVDGYFSSGLDLQELLTLAEDRRREPFEKLLRLYRTLLLCPKPTIAALSGSAILGGWILAMACDWRLAGPSAKVALSEIRAGLSPTSALVARLRELSCDPRAVKEMVLRGKTLGAEGAFAAGLVDEVLPAVEVSAAAQRLARKLTKSPPKAFAEIKRSLNAVAASDEKWQEALREFSEIFAGPEAREGVAALAAKRRPRWEDS